MAKRCKIAFAGGTNVVRISKPVFDVDTASLSQLLVHEQFLLSQIVETGYVARPSGGSGGTVMVTVPFARPLTYYPVIDLFPIVGGSICMFSKNFSRDMAIDGPGVSAEYSQVALSQFRLHFYGACSGSYYAVRRQRATS